MHSPYCEKPDETAQTQLVSVPFPASCKSKLPDTLKTERADCFTWSAGILHNKNLRRRCHAKLYILEPDEINFRPRRS